MIVVYVVGALVVAALAALSIIYFCGPLINL